ncbi:type I-B CRISPR-associated protein Cas7/Csh2 [candidate division WOR-3 bacterium JGI_Cruoil_03_51_56]|mgnify:CR=1 FL=1|uniref:Type I-B CRISPR-associated protein Cas7/Csh2 n=1 Tax=candidate division WOR-3 bacterium JGI_Cruoil_03_51_56 TaxID=1973747 RepID=A0A235BXC9_UNCW3|nr:MAG: type I-B CRISPR-associated protein Cas7/Csh2 [candidate division WOR-3 bacterium JGI_Cruoil_03_51_56]
MKNQNQTINNSDILFVYDAKMCNPNGDPDEENKPRMDYETEKNLVSDVRLKRYIRDYLMGLGSDIWVSKVEDKTVSAKERYAGLLAEFNKSEGSKVVPKKPTEGFKNWLLDKLIDARMFGATIPIGEEGKGGGASLTYTGPIQFSWGISLHPVELVPSSTISSTFAGRERSREGKEEQEYGTFGKDWRVFYSLIAFHGIISGHRADKTRLKPADINTLDKALLAAIPHEATTRSKLGQAPRFYLRVEYNDQETTLGDLRRHVKFEPKGQKAPIRNVTDFSLDLADLKSALEQNAEKIARLHYWKHSELSCKQELDTGGLKEKVIKLSTKGPLEQE